MKLTIKVLKGDECHIEVEESTTIARLKQNIETLMGIPTAHQKLIYSGKTLLDSKTIAFYPGVKEGSKLMLVVKKPEPLHDTMLKYFKKYYNETQSEQLAKEFMFDFEAKLKQYSLDDLERVAEQCLAQEIK